MRHDLVPIARRLFGRSTQRGLLLACLVFNAFVSNVAAQQMDPSAGASFLQRRESGAMRYDRMFPDPPPAHYMPAMNPNGVPPVAGGQAPAFGAPSPYMAMPAFAGAPPAMMAPPPSAGVGVGRDMNFEQMGQDVTEAVNANPAAADMDNTAAAQTSTDNTDTDTSSSSSSSSSEDMSSQSQTDSTNDDAQNTDNQNQNQAQDSDMQQPSAQQQGGQFASDPRFVARSWRGRYGPDRAGIDANNNFQSATADSQNFYNPASEYMAGYGSSSDGHYGSQGSYGRFDGTQGLNAGPGAYMGRNMRMKQSFPMSGGAMSPYGAGMSSYNMMNTLSSMGGGGGMPMGGGSGMSMGGAMGGPGMMGVGGMGASAGMMNPYMMSYNMMGGGLQTPSADYHLGYMHAMTGAPYGGLPIMMTPFGPTPMTQLLGGGAPMGTMGRPGMGAMTPLPAVAAASNGDSKLSDLEHKLERIEEKVEKLAELK